MNEVTLFEIPIYSMEEKEFNRRWDKEIKKYIYTNEQYNQIRNTFFPKNLWKYNQIIGYIVINLVKYDYGIDINFEWYQSDKKLYRFNSNEKNFVQNESLNGYHFFVDESDSNNEIKNEIREWLNDLLKDECLKKRYVDLSVFEIQLKYMNIKEFINDLNKRGDNDAKGEK